MYTAYTSTVTEDNEVIFYSDEDNYNYERETLIETIMDFNKCTYEEASKYADDLNNKSMKTLKQSREVSFMK